MQEYVGWGMCWHKKKIAEQKFRNPPQINPYLFFDLKSINMQLNCAFEVGCLVLVDNAVLCQLIQHGGNLRKQSLGSSLLGGCAQSLHGVAGSLVIEAVVSALRNSLANSLL